MKTNYLILTAAFLMAVLSCKKEEAEITSPELSTELFSAEEEILSDADASYLDDISEESFDFANGSMSERTAEEWTIGTVADTMPGDPCATRTWQVVDSLHRVLTIDFGPEPCLCRDSIYRKGVVIIHFEGRRGAPGFKKTITFRNYFVNRIQIEGKINVVYQGAFKWTRTLEGGLNIYPDGTRARRQSRHLIEQLEGMQSPGRRGDVFRITGTSNGINRREVRYISNIREPLIRKYEPGCARVFVKGVVVTKTGNGNEAILNYDPDGTAPCDRVASLTINGETRIIRL